MYKSGFPHGLMFHYFHDRGEKAKDQGSLSADDFERILLFVGLKNILSPEEWILRLKEKKLKPTDVCITFDDGLRCQYDVCLPVLEKYGLRTFWFIYSSVFEGQLGKLDIYRILRTRCFKRVEEFYTCFFKRAEEVMTEAAKSEKYKCYYTARKRAFPFYSDEDIMYRFIRDEALGQHRYEKLMDSLVEEAGLLNNTELLTTFWLRNEHLRELREKGHSIGLHSYDHPTAIEQLSYEDQFAQYSYNLKHIQSVCDQTPVAMSHPCNSYNEDSIGVLESLDIICGFRSNMGSTKTLNARLEMPREDSANLLQLVYS